MVIDTELLVKPTVNRYVAGKDISKTRVVVAMSGGVDSSVAAALLKDQGYEVIGITLQLYDNADATKNTKSCCASRDISDARNVAQHIDIAHYVLNYESLFKESVIDEFANSYVRGETPIPCVSCNQTVKFRDLFKFAKNLNADALVTGHYVKKIINEQGKAELHKASDHGKDQSYFLFSTTQEQLDFIDFPLGNLNKEQTRQLARHYNLPIAEKPDSQNICFVPDGNYAALVEKLRPEAFVKGDIIHVNGQKLGMHKGIAHYTIGQRKGLGIAANEPLYVTKIDPVNNQIIVGAVDDLKDNKLSVKMVNWLGEAIVPGESIEVLVKLRSMHQPTRAILQKAMNLEIGNDVIADIVDDAKDNMPNDIFNVQLTIPQKSITPGQACVIYDNDRLLGGGWILRD